MLEKQYLERQLARIRWLAAAQPLLSAIAARAVIMVLRLHVRSPAAIQAHIPLFTVDHAGGFGGLPGVGAARRKLDRALGRDPRTGLALGGRRAPSPTYWFTSCKAGDGAFCFSPVPRYRPGPRWAPSIVGLFANEVLPLRAGELIRCFLMARWSKIPDLGDAWRRR